MSQSVPHPHDISNLLQPALSGIVTALADRGSSGERYAARAIEVWTLVQSFQPRDAIDLMLTGQLVAFHELLADGMRDLLRGMVDTMKPRTRSSLIAMGRLSLGYADRLEKRGIQPYRTEIAAAQPEQAAVRTAQKQSGPPPERAPLAAMPAASSEAASSGPVPYPALAGAADPAEPGYDDTDAGPAVAATSWLDEPYEEWVIETPAGLAKRAEADQETAVLNADRAAADAPLEAKSWYVDIANPSIDVLPEPAVSFRSRDGTNGSLPGRSA